jgi:hypothetical protein
MRAEEREGGPAWQSLGHGRNRSEGAPAKAPFGPRQPIGVNERSGLGCGGVGGNDGG